MTKALTNEEFLQKLKDNGIEDIPLDEYVNSQTKIRWMCCNNEKHIYKATPSDMFRPSSIHKHSGCPYCSHRKVFVGETDLWTTNPEIAKLLLNQDEGYELMAGSGKATDWVCDKCGHIIRNKTVLDVCKRGLRCPNCSDGVSFPEKFVANMLSQLNCDFIHNKTTAWSGGKQYDFLIESISLIIETHGIQHYEHGFSCIGSKRRPRTLEEEIANDLYKKNLAISNGIKNYIELDCRYSDFDYIKKSILNSRLSELFDLSSIDWSECQKSTTTSNIILCANLWNDGIKNTADISKITKLNICTVISCLKKAKESGLCDYVKYNRKKDKTKYRNILCIETEKVYECEDDFIKDGYNRKTVLGCCGGTRETAYGKHWKYL